MIKFTKEEISLCKQVAERHRKELNCGDWIVDLNEIPVICIGREFPGKEVIPLWTVSDCLEFFEEKGFNHIYSFIHFIDGNWTFTAENSIESDHFKRTRGGGETRLAACLTGILAVLVEGA